MGWGQGSRVKEGDIKKKMDWMMDGKEENRGKGSRLHK